MSELIIPKQILIMVQSREVAPAIVFEKTKWNYDGTGDKDQVTLV